ncbi:ribosome biogenesis GTPase Der [Pyruvatibacter mobilis]|jgi:GTP-binding protein|uniref:ribosome biogenesis GTPase Der n=1 Tax=Pyruvatibacter mobilis TaxID=1712261 RepID=UPI003BA8B0B9
MSFTLAIVGRPNVGKSTLFNRLVGKKLALVDDTPGVTRDRREGDARLGDIHFKIIDTAGFEDASGDVLPARMRRQTEAAIAAADVCLFLVDARAGIMPLDEEIARILRKDETPVILAANKCEGKQGEAGRMEAFRLGLGEPLGISAEHGEGTADLYGALLPFAEEAGAFEEDEQEAEPAIDMDAEDADDIVDEEIDDEKPLRLAVVGRPNAGKSTLINALIGEDRMLTGPEAGITRDSISVDWKVGKRRIKLWDTAGLRRRARVTEKLEKLSVADTLRAVDFAEVVVLLIDATQPFEKQDLHIADLVVNEGRSLVLAISKWDLVEDRAAARREIDQRIDELLPQVKGIEIVPISSMTGQGLDKIIPAALRAYTRWTRRVSTAALNRWLEIAVSRHQPPAVQGRRIRLRYMTQAKSRPPTFIVFSQRAEKLPDSYVRYLVNGLRERFDLDGTPIRLMMRKGDNPYAAKRTRRGTSIKAKIKSKAASKPKKG